MRLMNKVRAYRQAMLCGLLLAVLLSGCRGAGSANAEETSPEAGMPETEISSEQYEESIAVSNVNEAASPYYGIMYASVMDINGSQGDSSTVYSFRDKSDPENVWSVTELEIGAIEAEISEGADVALLFHGDVIRDSENIEFIAVLPDGSYTLKRTEGITLSNTMSTFTLITGSGEDITFIKDNCRIEDGAMSTDSGDSVVVYYADGGELGNYPLRIYSLS